jgi:hypothetical protein
LQRRLYRAISRRDYDQLRALKPVLGVAHPLWRSKELPTRQSLHDLPPCRLVASRPRPNSAPETGPSHGSRDPVLRFGSQSRGRRSRLDRPPLPRQGGVPYAPDPAKKALFALSKYRVDVVLRELVRRQPSPHRPSNTWLHNGGNPEGEDQHHSHPTQTRLTASVEAGQTSEPPH